VLKILHTADWHVGRSFGLFDDADSQKLERERITVVDRILGLADSFDVDAVLCAGDLFDEPQPDPQWWQALGERLAEASSPNRPIVLLPGNHDPLLPDSVYSPSHSFRKDLPESVHVVDDDKFALELNDGAVVYAAPCTSRAGDRDLAMALPDREPDDNRVRIGMAHGSTFEMAGSTNFPISKEAPAKRGLDYLAIGDTHSWHEIRNGCHAPIVYPGTPEPTSFSERDAGFVALVSFRRSGATPRVRQQRVNRWTWKDTTVTNMEDLRKLAKDDLKSTVLRLRLDMTVDMQELEEVDRVVGSLQGTKAVNPRTGACICDRSNLGVNVSGWSIDNVALPETITAVIERLKGEAESNSLAQRALLILRRMLNESLQEGA
jgi:DNA repair exonuclease SbcCD nuclease subunit